MEPAVAIELVGHSKILSDANVQVDTIIGDDDCTTIARLRSHLGRNIEKLSDINHVQKGLRGHLTTLETRHKKMTQMVTAYFLKMFSMHWHATKMTQKV
jgi:uncharacterized membrane protein YjjP (DUF1212 family)